MWQLENAWGEMVLRAVLVYGVVFVLFRLIGKKQLGQFSPFDFVLLLILSESISNGLSGGDNSLTGAAISAVTLLGLSRLMDELAFRSRRFEKVMDGEPQIIVADGEIREDVRCRQRITLEELMSALRQHDVESVKDLKFAILETNGKISVIKR